MEHIIIALSAFVGISIGVVIGKKLYFKPSAVNESDLQALQMANTKLTENIRYLEITNAELKTDYDGAKKEVLALERSNATLETTKNELVKDLDASDAKNIALVEKLNADFENLANRIFETHTGKFKTESSASLKLLLDPYKQKMEDLMKSVITSGSEDMKERIALKSELERLITVSRDMQTEAKNLTEALRSDSKAQGRWGELVLERVLERTGLREGEEYVLQGKDISLKDDEGKMLKPDVVINLPDNKHMVIDSKVSLKNYDGYVNADDDVQRNVQLKLFLASARERVTELSDKAYHNAEGLGAPDFVFLFMPLEGAFSLAMQSEPDIFGDAWDKKVIIVSPTTLFTAMKTVANIWKQDRQNRNAFEIARQAGALYDKFEGVWTDLVDIQTKFHKADEALTETINKVKDGKGNLIGRVEKLRELGAKNTKALPLAVVEQV